jgi:hypothetical protein
VTSSLTRIPADTHFVVYLNAKDPKPSMELNSRVFSKHGRL